MDEYKDVDETKEEFVDSRNVKTIRSLRKSSAKKSANSTKSDAIQQKESSKDFRITKKKAVNNKMRIQGSESEYLDYSGINNGSVPVLNQEERIEQEGSLPNSENNGKAIMNRKFNMLKNNVKPGTKAQKI